MRPKYRYLAASYLAAALAVAAPSLSHALVINTNFVPIGNPITPAGSSSPNISQPIPTTTSGGGNFQTIFNTAAAYWERVFPNTNDTLNINVGFANLGASTLGIASQFPPRVFQDPNVAETQTGSVRFTTGVTWFFDPTPTESSEYQIDQTIDADLGGGVINTSRQFGADFGSEVFTDFDLLTVALHEIGHLLGLAPLTGGVPFPSVLELDDGSLIPLTLTGGGHIDQFAIDNPNTPGNESTVFDGALMITTIANGQRRLASDADALTIAQLSGFDTVALDQAGFISNIPLPAPILLLVSALAGFGCYIRRRQI